MCPRVAIRQEACKIGHVALPRSKYAFLTLPRYSMIALSNALEGCRMANYVTGSDAYSWRVVTLEGASIAASNGLKNKIPRRRLVFIFGFRDWIRSDGFSSR